MSRACKTSSPLDALASITQPFWKSSVKSRGPMSVERRFETDILISPRLWTAEEAGVLSLHVGYSTNRKIDQVQTTPVSCLAPPLCHVDTILLKFISHLLPGW